MKCATALQWKHIIHAYMYGVDVFDVKPYLQYICFSYQNYVMLFEPCVRIDKTDARHHQVAAFSPI